MIDLILLRDVFAFDWFSFGELDREENEYVEFFRMTDDFVYAVFGEKIEGQIKELQRGEYLEIQFEMKLKNIQIKEILNTLKRGKK